MGAKYKVDLYKAVVVQHVRDSNFKRATQGFAPSLLNGKFQKEPRHLIGGEINFAGVTLRAAAYSAGEMRGESFFLI